MRWRWFTRSDPEKEVEVLYRLWKEGIPREAFEARLIRFHALGPPALALLAHWAAREEDRERAVFATAALVELRDPKALDFLEPLLQQAKLPDDRKLELTSLVLRLGGEPNVEGIWEGLEDPEGISRTFIRKIVDLADEPQAVAMFLGNFRKIPSEMRPDTLKDLLSLSQDPRAVRLWAPLLYLYGEALGSELAELVRATPLPLANWWLRELSASNPNHRFLRFHARELFRDQEAAPRIDSMAHSPGRFHQAYLSAPDGAGSRMAVFSQKKASGEILFINFLANDLLGIKDAFGGMVEERRFKEAMAKIRMRRLEGLLVAPINHSVAVQVMREAERLTFEKGGRFPEEYLAWKETFFCLQEGQLLDAGPFGGAQTRESRFEIFWSESNLPLPNRPPLPTAQEVEELLRCPCAGRWGLLDSSGRGWVHSSGGGGGSLKKAIQKARRKARHSGPQGDESGSPGGDRQDACDRQDAEGYLEYLPKFLPDRLLPLWQKRLKDYALVVYLLGELNRARIARDCAQGLISALKAAHPFLKALSLKTLLPIEREKKAARGKGAPEPLSRLQNWVYQHPRLSRELAEVIDKKLAKGSREIILDEAGSMRFSLVTEWFLFDKPSSSYPNKTPLEVFLEEEPLDPADRQFFESWRGNLFGVFKIIQRRIGQGVRIQHLATGVQYEVVERLGSLGLTPGMSIIARLLKAEGHHLFGGGILPLPEEMTYALERESKRQGWDLKISPLQALSLWEKGAKGGGFALPGPEEEQDRDIEKVEQDLEQLLKQWGVRWLSVCGIEEKLRRHRDAHQLLPKLFEEILVQADHPPKEEKQAIKRLADLLLELLRYLPEEGGGAPDDRRVDHPIGPKENAIAAVLLRESIQRTEGASLPHEAHSRRESPSSQKDSFPGKDSFPRKEQDHWQDRWLNTAQQELGGRTPREVILEERRGLGNPSREIRYRFYHGEIPSPQDFGIRHQRALRLQREGRYAQAIRLYESLLGEFKEDPERYRLLGNLGTAHSLSGNKRQGMKYLKESLRLRPDYELPQANLRLIGERSQESLLTLGHLQGALGRRKALQEAHVSQRERALRLVELIRERRFGWPIPEMEELLKNPFAFQAISQTLGEETIEKEETIENLLAFLVLLGELKNPQALEPLREVVLKEKEFHLAGVAMESMARIGPESFLLFKTLLQAPSSAPPPPAPRSTLPPTPAPRRLLAYCGIGLSQHPDAYPFLVKALEEEQEVKEAVAYALTLLGNQEAIPEIYSTYQNWQSPWADEMEEAIGTLAFPEAKGDPPNWRIRYRPIMGIPPPLWSFLSSGAMAHAQPKRGKSHLGRSPVKKTLHQILEEQKQQRVAGAEAPSCESCGEKFTFVWGLPICSENRARSHEVANDCLEHFKAQHLEEVADALDFLDLENLDRIRFPGPEDDEEAYLTGFFHMVLYDCLKQGLTTFSELERALRRGATPPP